MNLSSTGNCRYMHLLPFHTPTHHFIHYSYTYGKTSLTWFWKKKKKKKIQYLGLAGTTFIKWKSREIMSLLCISMWKLIFTLSHHTTEDLRIILPYIPMQVLGSKFRHIPVLNKPKCLSICDKLSKLNGVENLLVCVTSLVEKYLANSIWLVTQHSMNAAYVWLTLNSDSEYKM